MLIPLIYRDEVAETITVNSATDITLPDKHKIGEPKILFDKITDESLETLRVKVSDTTDISELFK